MNFFKKLIFLFRSFFSKDLFSMAACLSFYTLLSIVPALALMFGIAKGFNLEEALENYIHRMLESQQEVATYLITFSKQLLDSTKEKWIAGVGVLFLLLSGFSLLSHVEQAFNSLWHIEKARPFSKKLSDYLAFIFIAPLILVFSSASMYTLYHFSSDIFFFKDLPEGTWLVLPLATLTFLFFLVYRFIPLSKVQVFPAFIAALFTGVFYLLIEAIFVSSIIKVMNYNVVYGSFAIFPVFLIWLYGVWLIILEGCSLAYCLQHFSFLLYAPLKEYASISQAAMAYKLLQVFFQHEGKNAAYSVLQLQKQAGLPSQHIRLLLKFFEYQKWVVKEEEGYTFIKDFQPSLKTVLWAYLLWGRQAPKAFQEEQQRAREFLQSLRDSEA